MIGIDHNQFVVTIVKNLKPQIALAIFFINNDSGSKTSINNTDGQYPNANNTQEWIDPENNLKIHFTYLPEYLLAANTTQLIFHVESLQTGSYLQHLNNFWVDILL
ncbi:MAG: hypothetical protein WAM14_06930 [Candidatus Nitrosopolaris sp.]